MKNVYKHTAIFNGKNFEHFGIHSLNALLYGHKAEDILRVELIIAEDQTIPPPPQNDKDVLKPDYWGWLDSTINEFTMVYPKRFLLEICFPAGLKATEEKGRGKAYRLNVLKIENDK